VDVAESLNVPLSAAIGEVRRELERAMLEGSDSEVAFRAGAIEFEFTVGFERTADADAGVRVWVVSLGGKAGLQHTETNRLKVTLTPVNREDEDEDLVIRSTRSG